MLEKSNEYCLTIWVVSGFILLKCDEQTCHLSICQSMSGGRCDREAFCYGYSAICGKGRFWWAKDVRQVANCVLPDFDSAFPESGLFNQLCRESHGRLPHEILTSLPCCFTAYLYGNPAVSTRETFSPRCMYIVAPVVAPSVRRRTCIVAGCEVLFAISKSTS